MLKWTVATRRDGDSNQCRPLASNCANKTPERTPRQKTKRRRSSASRRRSNGRKSIDDADKENQFTSTPIKSGDNFLQLDAALRDVSNLTPNDGRRRRSDKKSTPKLTIKKKKECLNSHENYFKPFEAVDSHIESILAEELCRCNKQTDSCKKNLFAAGPGDCPPTKKAKIETIDDLLPDRDKFALPGLILNSNTKQLFDNEVRITPLVRKFLDLQFSKCADANDSSFINDMSLDKIVDAILENSKEERHNLTGNTSMVVNLDEENDANKSREENIMNAEQEKQLSDSGFRSNSTDNSHYLCKCNNNNLVDVPLLDTTIIEIDESFNERCVDSEVTRKRSSTTPEDADDSKKIKLDDNCTLRRQKCVRRRKVEHFRKKLYQLDNSIESKTISPFWSSQKKLTTVLSDEDSSLTPGVQYGNTPLRGCYLESKAILREESDDGKSFRRCLVFESPPPNESTSFSDSTMRSFNNDVRGSIDLAVWAQNGTVFVTVIRCQDLYRPNGDKINAYVKVTSCDTLDGSRRKKSIVLHRTPVQSESSRPVFNHTFRFPATQPDNQTRFHVEVWHRDRTTKTSEFLGCMSFDVNDALNKKICGSYRLLPEASGRVGNLPIAHDSSQADRKLNVHLDDIMGENNQDGGNVTEEIASLDGVETELRRSTNKATLSEQQKHADENLFLRYLELDPTEGPDAIPAALQRKATGNKFGRTPFTQTKRLVRPAKSGFGFSVVWTHPPRIERVEKGLPADRAGILPGDYIIFVDKHNVVTMPEIEILNLIRSYGSQLTLEIFRRNPSRNGSVPTHHRSGSTALVTSGSIRTDSNVNLSGTTPALLQRRPSTVCSTNTASVDYRRRKLHLPQVTFSTETPSNSPDEIRKRTMYQLIGKEQQYATALQFAITRFVSSLAERRDLISPSEHRILFQNCEELLRITEDILDNLVHDDGEIEVNLLARVYGAKLREMTCAYKRYCAGIKKADCVLANKMKNANSEFVRFVQSPAVPRRRPDITTFIHKPLEHYREVLKALMAVQNATKPNHQDYAVINQIVHEMQVSYREITAEAGLMEPTGEGRPLLSVQDLENRLVFTKCKPFVLNKPGRQWIFGGALSRVEGRNLRQYWALLFSDILLLAKVSRDRVLFITDDPIPLAYVTDMFFNVRKKDTEFRICVNSDAKNDASSPTVHCGPDLTRTPRKNAAKKTVVLRAPTLEMKAVWQNLLQRQIFHLNAGLDGSSLSSPLESPEVPITSSVVTLQSAETCSLRRQPPNLAEQNRRNNNEDTRVDVKKQIETLIEHKCKQMGKGSFNGKCNAIHLEQWMKGQLDDSDLPSDSPVIEQIGEEWTEEMLRKRSEELQLIDSHGNVTNSIESKIGAHKCEESQLSEHEQSPSKSTTTESQVTVRSSPLVPESVPMCRQCHKNCLSNVLSNSKLNETPQSANHGPSENSVSNQVNETNDWQSLVLLGLCTNPVAGLVNYDPFQTIKPESADTQITMTNGDGIMTNCVPNTAEETDISPDDSPQTEEHPYHSLSSSALTLRRFGTVSSLERFESDEHIDGKHENHLESDDSDDEDEDDLGVDNEAFNHSSVMSWTAKAGSFVAQKMAFFEKLGEDYRSGTGFFERYLKSSEVYVNGEDVQEEETSGGTSGEEIWGTPTSGGDLDDPPNSPNYEGKQSPNNGSVSSDNMDDTEIMMDELLMAPPITGAAMRGLLPRRTLEPLIEEDFSETSSSESSEDASARSGSSEQGNATGSAADTCSRDAADLGRTDAASDSTEYHSEVMIAPASSPTGPTTETTKLTNTAANYETEDAGGGQMSNCSVADFDPRMPRSESYRRIVDAAEEAAIARSMATTEIQNNVIFFEQFRPAAKFANIERVPRSRSIRIFEFFNVRRTERRIYEKFPENRHLVKMFSQENVISDSVPTCYDEKVVASKKMKDKQMDRRFWKQLSKRRGSVKVNPPA